MVKAAIAALVFLLMSNFAVAGDSLSNFSNKELVKRFEKSICKEDGYEEAGNFLDELKKRKAIKEIVGLLDKDEGFIIDAWCYQALAELRSHETDRLLKPVATSGGDDKNYYANRYFAEVGEKFALKNLNQHYFQYGGPSREWAEVADLFGKYKYYPAKRHLVSTILAADLSLAGASAEALMMLYPETKNQVKGLGIHATFSFYSSYVVNH